MEREGFVGGSFDLGMADCWMVCRGDSFEGGFGKCARVIEESSSAQDGDGRYESCGFTLIDCFHTMES
jgi:hypothetical protein